MADEVVTGLYSPSRKEVACVLLQAAMGGDRRVCRAVNDWCVEVADDFIMVSAPWSQWERLGEMKKEDRPGVERFKPQAVSENAE